MLKKNTKNSINKYAHVVGHLHEHVVFIHVHDKMYANSEYVTIIISPPGSGVKNTTVLLTVVPPGPTASTLRSYTVPAVSEERMRVREEVTTVISCVEFCALYTTV